MKTFLKISHFEDGDNIEVREVNTLNGYKKDKLYTSGTRIFMFVSDENSGISQFKSKYVKMLNERIRKFEKTEINTIK